MVSPFSEVYRKRRVLVTGHTGFKGTWLTLWLHRLGAQVTGLSLAPEKGGMFIAVGAKELCTSLRGDIRRYQTVADALAEVRPEVVFHLAAQSLVLRGYREPLETFATNALGTAHLLEALRRRNRPASVVVVSSDKCYAPSAAPRGYREGDPLGGDDPYAMSKAATELLVECYRASYFTEGTLRVASARAGNVIGGGDWASDRLVPDVIRALRNGAPITLRNPQAIRPWQHVLEPVGGYLRLGAHLLAGDERAYGPFNFGPRSKDMVPTAELVGLVLKAWGSKAHWKRTPPRAKEAATLRLSHQKAKALLGYFPTWDLAEAVRRTVAWYRQTTNARRSTLEDIAAFEARLTPLCLPRGGEISTSRPHRVQ